MPNEPAFEPLLTIKETAQRIKTCTRTVHRMIADVDDPLPVIRIGRLLRVRQCDLDRYIAAHRHD